MAIHISEPLESSGHKRRQSILGTEVDVLRGPRVVAADKSRGLSGNICCLKQQSAANGGAGGGEASCCWAEFRWIV